VNIAIGDDGTHLIGLFPSGSVKSCLPGTQQPAGVIALRVAATCCSQVYAQGALCREGVATGACRQWARIFQRCPPATQVGRQRSQDRTVSARDIRDAVASSHSQTNCETP
jgi:putative component of membrane protein insertase Oxa1/YidC/SpoIIIJ protein YidD